MLKDLENKINEEKDLELKKDDVMLMREVADEKEKMIKFERFSTGFENIDNVAKMKPEDKGGLSGGDIVIVAAPTGNGKTLFSATLTQQMTEKEGIPALWFTYEVNPYHLWQIFKNMGAKDEDIITTPLEQTTGQIEWIEKKIKEAKEKFYVKLVVIDHLGFLAPRQKIGSNMNQNYSAYLTQLVRELKTLAVNEDIIIVLPVHMVKSAGDEPTLRDIGHSGGIAQESDMVVLLAREENPKSSMGGVSENDYYSKYTKITIAKNRIGDGTPTWWMEKSNGRLIKTIKEENNESIC